MTIHIAIMVILFVSVLGAAFMFLRTLNQKQKLHEIIIRSQNEKEIETYNRIASEYLHQQVINGRILPHLIQLKELYQIIEASKIENKSIAIYKIQSLIKELNHTESIIRNISENIFPPHLNYFFIETCQKRFKDLQLLYPNNAEIIFNTEGTFNDLALYPTLLYNLYSLMDLFVTNSLQKAQASYIIVQLNHQDNFLYLTMSDNGIGFDFPSIEYTSKGRGLADIKGKALLLSTGYSFKSEKGIGTQFNITIRLKELTDEE